MSTIRKQFSKEFKAKVALEAMRGLKTTAELSSEYGVHSTQINQWKKELQEGVAGIFERGKNADEKEQEKLVDRLYRQIGQLQVECDWLKKKLPF